jgi:hypothetical protein
MIQLVARSSASASHGTFGSTLNSCTVLVSITASRNECSDQIKR